MTKQDILIEKLLEKGIYKLGNNKQLYELSLEELQELLRRAEKR
ncbi:Fur-regulated basic protein FbpA [Ectobacillus panaciterrae]|nr:Fur-regulated basic protein FbpA [Ectobacillus panaciterrae]